MKTSDMYNMPLADLYNMRRKTWDKINLARKNNVSDEEMRPITENMAYIQKVLEDRDGAS